MKVRGRAERALADSVAVFERLGWTAIGPPQDLAARLRGPEEPDLVVRLAREGGYLGGTYGLEVSTAEPVLPASAGVRARGAGAVRMTGVRFMPRGRDPDARRIAGTCERDERLREALTRVHFERIAIEPDGRPVIRHLGGSVVYVTIPPLVRATPLTEQQGAEIVRALRAFAECGRALA